MGIPGPNGFTGGGARIDAGMGLLVATVVGVVVWIVLWALGLKAFDAGLIGLLIVLLAAGARMAAPYLPGNAPRSRD